ncbi:MAG: hypothetical protein QOK72_11455, partial [Nitrososphaeraceae archaeon]|nr:hypothetical protein [Nitrososphaeraceae archaeon]
KKDNDYYKLDFSESLDVELWGAVGDELKDDSQALKKALDYCILTGTKLTSKKNKVYLISNNIIIDTLNSKSGTIIDFNFSTIKLNGANIKITHNNNTPYLTTSLTADLNRGATFLSLANVTGIEIGDLIEVESPAITTNNINVSQYYVVNDLDGNNVYVDGYIVNDVNPQQIIDDGKTGNIVVRLRKTGKGLTIRNFKLVGDRSKEQTSLVIQNQHNCTIENYEVVDSTREGIYMLYNGLTRHFNGNFKVFGYVRYDQGYNSVPSSPGGLSFGYGLIHARNAISFVDNCEGSYGWHAFDAARGETFITYSNCRGFKNAFTFSTHEGAWDVRYNNPDVFGGHGITTRTVFMTVNGGTLRTNFGHGIAGLGASETSIQGVTIDNVYGGVNKGAALYTPGLIIYGAGAKSKDRNQKAIIRNNLLINQSQEVSASAEELIFENNIVKNVEGFYTSLNIKGSKKLYCRFNNLYDIINASAITFQVYNNQFAIFENNKIFGNFQTTAGAAMFVSNGSVTADTTDIQLINNSCSPAVALVRNLTANSNIRFTKIERNTNYLRLFLSDIVFKMVDVFNNVGNQPI